MREPDLALPKLEPYLPEASLLRKSDTERVTTDVLRSSTGYTEGVPEEGG